MVTATRTLSFGALLDDLVMRSAQVDVAPHVAEKARHATHAALRLPLGAPATIAVRRRAEAYFSAVIRRSTMRGASGGRATARLIAAAVVADLREAGRTSDDIWTELQRGWSERLPGDVLEEYRLRLCG